MQYSQKKKRKDFPLYPIFNGNSLKNSKSVIDQITDQSKSVNKFGLLKDYPGFRVASRLEEDKSRCKKIRWATVVTLANS